VFAQLVIDPNIEDLFAVHPNLKIEDVMAALMFGNDAVEAQFRRKSDSVKLSLGVM
jgi:hypothetical protein